jgi:hypothetical protein
MKITVIKLIFVLFLSTIVSLGTLGASLFAQENFFDSQLPWYPRNSNTGQGVSRNWSGYAATEGSFTAVSGTWTVPIQSGKNNFGADATWVGIGGVATKDLIQAGTQTTVTRNNQVTYEAFFEKLPDASQPLEVAVSGGDSVTVSVSQQTVGQWKISFKNNTNGQSKEITEVYDSSLSSAEWIEEAPSSPRRIVPLDNFGSVKFTNGTTVKDGQTLNIAQANARAITMASRSQTLAKPSALENDGTGFTVTRVTAFASQTRRPLPLSFRDGENSLPDLSLILRRFFL